MGFNTALFHYAASLCSRSACDSIHSWCRLGIRQLSHSRKTCQRACAKNELPNLYFLSIAVLLKRNIPQLLSNATLSFHIFGKLPATVALISAATP